MLNVLVSKVAAILRINSSESINLTSAAYVNTNN
jgi:hypothetical protein